MMSRQCVVAGSVSKKSNCILLLNKKLFLECESRVINNIEKCCSFISDLSSAGGWERVRERKRELERERESKGETETERERMSPTKYRAS